MSERMLRSFRPRPGIVLLELFDQPPRIVNPDVKLVVGVPQKGAGQVAQLTRGCTRQT